MLEITNKEEFFEEKCPVFLQYDGQCSPQSAFIELDARDKSVYVSANTEIGNAVPVYVWNHKAVRIGISPYSRGYSIRNFIDEHMEEFEEILDDWEEVYNGQNYVGHFGEKAEKLIESLDNGDYYTGAMAEIDQADVYHASDWYQDEICYYYENGEIAYREEKNGYCLICGKYRIDESTKEEKLQEIAEFLESECPKEYNIMIDGSAIDVLTDIYYNY
jgi:hypothetical protein